MDWIDLIVYNPSCFSNGDSPTDGVEIEDLVIQGVDPAAIFTNMIIIGQGFGAFFLSFFLSFVALDYSFSLLF